MIIATARDDARHARADLDQVLDTLQHRGALKRLHLMGLTPSDVQALLGSSSREASSGLLSRLSGGNPFYLGELLREGCGSNSDESPAAPLLSSALRDVLVRRVADLGDLVYAVLCEASVFGVEVEPASLAATFGRELDEVERALESAAAAGIVLRCMSGSYVFAHEINVYALSRSMDEETRALALDRAAKATVRQ
jgi:hypothetical protein